MAVNLEQELLQAKRRIAELGAELREAHHWGYMAGVGDSEDYDHDPSVMEKEAWADYLAEKVDE